MKQSQNRSVFSISVGTFWMLKLVFLKCTFFFFIKPSIVLCLIFHSPPFQLWKTTLSPAHMSSHEAEGENIQLKSARIRVETTTSRCAGVLPAVSHEVMMLMDRPGLALVHPSDLDGQTAENRRVHSYRSIWIKCPNTGCIRFPSVYSKNTTFHNPTQQ